MFLLTHLPSGSFDRFLGAPAVPSEICFRGRFFNARARFRGHAKMAPVSRKSVAVFFLQFSIQISIKKCTFWSISHTELISAPLSLYPFWVKEGPKRSFLSDVPFGRFCLATYPSAEFAVSGASWSFWVLLG